MQPELYNTENIVEKQAQQYWNASRAWRGLRQPDKNIRALIDVMSVCQGLGSSPCQRVVNLSAQLLDETVTRGYHTNKRKEK